MSLGRLYRVAAMTASDATNAASEMIAQITAKGPAIKRPAFSCFSGATCSRPRTAWPSPCCRATCCTRRRRSGTLPRPGTGTDTEEPLDQLAEKYNAKAQELMTRANEAQ